MLHIQSFQTLGHSTPRKKSHSMPVRNGMVSHASRSFCEPEKVLQLEDYRADLRSLLLLATNFDLGDLKKS